MRQRSSERVGRLKIIQRWRWTARKFRQRAAAVVEKRGLWGATEALTLDARAWVLEQCARDLWRHMQGREVWPVSPEMAALIRPLEEMQAKVDLQRREWGAG